MQLYNQHTINLYNSLTGEKETFKPIHEGYVGMYVCYVSNTLNNQLLKQYVLHHALPIKYPLNLGP